MNTDASRPQITPTRRRAVVTAVAAIVSAAGLVGDTAGPAFAEALRQLKWDELVPATATAKPLKPFFGNRPADGARPGDDATPPAQDQAWMSGPAQQSSGPVPVVAALNGERVRLGGYVVPLDFEATKIKEFLLVPFVGACIHVPPPPANQIVYVKVAEPFEVKGSFDPVWVTGKMAVSTTFTGLAEAGYTIQADQVELRAKP